jgi:hypothetical protein
MPKIWEYSPFRLQQCNPLYRVRLLDNSLR